MTVTYHHDDILEVLIRHPPVNTLGGAVLQVLATAIEAAQADPAVKAIVIPQANESPHDRDVHFHCAVAAQY